MVIAKCSTVAPPEPVGHQSRGLVFEDGGCDVPLDATMDLYAIDAALVPMNSDTVANGNFVRWVEGVSGFQTDLVKSQIATGASVPATISALNARLDTSTYPITDLTYGLVLLSVIGQAHDASSVSPLNTFINQTAATMSCAPGDGGLPDAGDYITPVDCDEMLRVRATEMLAYIETIHPNLRQLMTNTLSIAKYHPSSAVRQAAIDAYMFNRGDTTDASDYLSSQIDASDRIFIGRPRMYGDFDASAFDDKLSAWYDAHSEQVPIVDAGTDVVLTTVNCNIDGGF
jgi:hypothetical protein